MPRPAKPQAPSLLALWFKHNEAGNLATLKAQALNNGHSKAAVSAALAEWALL